MVTLSSAGRARISLKHGLGVPNPNDLISLPPPLFYRSSTGWVGRKGTRGAMLRDRERQGVNPFSCSSLTHRVMTLEMGGFPPATNTLQRLNGWGCPFGIETGRGRPPISQRFWAKWLGMSVRN